MCRILTRFALLLFLSGGSLFSQPSDPATSSNKQTPDASNSAEMTRQDVGILHALADATEKSAEGQTRVKGFGNGLLLWDYWFAKTLSEEDRAGFALGTSLSQQLFLEDDPALAWLGVIAPVAERAGLLRKTEIEKMEDNAYLNGFVTPDPVPTLISSGRMAIESHLVSDSPPPANNITIETPQFVANPSNDGTEVDVASAPISIGITMSPDGPSIAGQTPWQSGVGLGSPKTSFWGKLNNFAQGFGEFAQSEEGQQFFQSLQPLLRPPNAGAARASNGNGSMCGPGYVFNTAKLAAVPKVAQLDAQGKTAQATALTRNPNGSYTAWCIPAKKQK